MVAFAGWSMPMRYKGGMEEHRAVRARAGLFDVSHMARFSVAGGDRVDFLDGLITNNVRKLAPGRALYTVLCDERGGILDDLVVYAREDRFLVVANAANHDTVWTWLTAHAAGDVTLSDESDALAQIALQGPKSEPILNAVLPAPTGALGYYHFIETTWHGATLIASRNGYTGEDGFELYVPAREAASLWRALIEAGARTSSPQGSRPGTRSAWRSPSPSTGTSCRAT